MRQNVIVPGETEGVLDNFLFKKKKKFLELCCRKRFKCMGNLTLGKETFTK